jgi:hypothetical protein
MYDAKKISELDQADPLTGGEQFPIVQGGKTKRASSSFLTDLKIDTAAIRDVTSTIRDATSVIQDRTNAIASSASASKDLAAQAALAAGAFTSAAATTVPVSVTAGLNYWVAAPDLSTMQLYKNDGGAPLALGILLTINAVLPLPVETGNILEWTDPITGRTPIRLTKEGQFQVDDIQLPTGMTLPANVKIPPSATFPDGVTLPVGTALPAGTVLPVGVVLPNASVDFSQLTSTLSALVARTLPPESLYMWALTDPVTGRDAIRVSRSGSVEIFDFVIAANAVDFIQLSASVQALLPASNTPEGGFIWELRDPVTGRSPVRLTSTGQFQADDILVRSDSVIFTDKSVPLSALAKDALRRAVPQPNDVIEVMPDMWRYSYGYIAVQTAQDGSLWSPFPSVKTQNIRGVNPTGVALQFRRTSGLPIRGTRIGTTFAPGALASLNYKGALNTTSAYPPAISQTQAAGDYYRYSGQTTTAWGANTLKLGDLVVYDGTAWQYQASPLPIGSVDAMSRVPGDFWEIASAGTFDGVAFAPGDRIVYVGFNSQSGTGFCYWYKGQPVVKGELFYKGEFSAAAGALPANPNQGDLWQVLAAGVIGGTTYSVGDYVLFDTNVWGLIPSDTIINVPAGGYVPALRCFESAAEWEVRLQSKATTLGVQLKVRHQSDSKGPSDTIVLRSDSMFGVPGVQKWLSDLVTPRAVVLSTKGGGTSTNVLSSFIQEVLDGDANQGAFNFFWHAQNNQPSGTNLTGTSAQVREVSLRLSRFIGTRDPRFAFLSVLGQCQMGWNGARIYCPQHEDQFNKTGPLYDLEQWYQTMFPRQWCSPRLACLKEAGLTQDMRAPGMTEAQTAALYGWVPYSFFAQLNGAWPFSISQLNHQGFWTNAALPTGGSPFDAYVRTTGDGLGIGTMLVNVAGVWGEYKIDITHLGSIASAGGPVIARMCNDFLNTNFL